MRETTFFDNEFRASRNDEPDDCGFIKNPVFIGMSFQGEEMNDVLFAIKDECKKLSLNPSKTLAKEP